MKKIFKIIYYLIFIAIAIIAIFLILSAIPIKGGYKSLIVLSGSMEPKIHTGSVVVVKPTDSYREGDVITFGEVSKTKTPTTHRIVGIEKTGDTEKYITKGDANNAEDNERVSKDEVLGKVIFSVPYVGYAVNTAQKPLGFLLIIIIPAVFIIFDEINKIKKEVKKKIDYRKRVKKRKEDGEENKSFDKKENEDLAKKKDGKKKERDDERK